MALQLPAQGLPSGKLDGNVEAGLLVGRRLYGLLVLIDTLVPDVAGPHRFGIGRFALGGAGLGRVGLGRVGLGRVGLGRVGIGRLDKGRLGGVRPGVRIGRDDSGVVSGMGNGQSRARLGHAGQRAHRVGLQAAETAGRDLEGHHRPHVDVPGAVGDGRAVEVDPVPGPELDDAEATGIVELGHVSHQRIPAGGDPVGRSAPDGRLGGHGSVDDLGQGQFDDVGGPPVLEGRDQYVDLRLRHHRLDGEPSSSEELRHGG